MRINFLFISMTAAFSAALLLNSCSLFNRESDPLKVEQQLAQARAGERELVQSVIADTERVDRFIALIDVRDQLAREQLEATKQQRDRITAISTDYQATREDFEVAFRSYNEAREKNQREYLAVVAAMKGATTADEWKVISKYQLKSLNPRQLAYKDIGGVF